VRKQSVNASLTLRRVVEELCFSVFLKHCVKMLHVHGSVGATISGYTDAEDNEVAQVNQTRQANDAERPAEQESFPFHRLPSYFPNELTTNLASLRNDNDSHASGACVPLGENKNKKVIPR
jgi:hypothetical protein